MTDTLIAQLRNSITDSVTASGAVAVVRYIEALADFQQTEAIRLYTEGNMQHDPDTWREGYYAECYANHLKLLLDDLKKAV